MAHVFSDRCDQCRKMLHICGCGPGQPRPEPVPPTPKHDPVNSPAHYQTASGLEAIDVIEAFGLGFNLGNAVKYALRAGRKGSRVEDLEKCIWYLRREIASDPKPST